MISSIVLLLANIKWEIHLNSCTKEIVLPQVNLPHITGTKPLASGEHQVEVKLILVCFRTVSLVDFSALCQGNTTATTFASVTAKHFHGAGDGSDTDSSVAQYLPACPTASTEWYLSKLV